MLQDISQALPLLQVSARKKFFFSWKKQEKLLNNFQLHNVFLSFCFSLPQKLEQHFFSSFFHWINFCCCCRRPMMLMMMAVEKWNICTRKNSITPKTLEHSELEQLEKRKKSNLINLLPFNMFTLWCGTAASWFFQSVLCTMRNAELALHSPTPFLSPITRKWLNRRVKCKNINLKSSQNFYYTSSSINIVVNCSC